MDLIKSHKKKSVVSEIAYVLMNIGLAASILILVRATQSPWMAMVLVVLSKWRALAVRPRYWFINIVSNIVDTLVGLSTVVFIASATGNLPLQLLFTVMYAIWLLFIKPRSKRAYVSLQAGIAIFVSITAISIISYNWNSLFFVLAVWLVGYSSIRHVLSSYDEPHTKIYSLIGGVVFAEMSWISYHWLRAYQLPGMGRVQFSQLALFTVLGCLIAERAYASWHRYGRVRKVDVLPPIVLLISVVFALWLLSTILGNEVL